MHEKQNQEDEIRIRHEMVSLRRQGPHQCQRQFRDVVEVARDAPVPGRDQQARTFYSGGAHTVARPDHSGTATPDAAFSVGATDLSNTWMNISLDMMKERKYVQIQDFDI